MSNEEVLLEAFKEKCGEWVCSEHNCESMQPAAVFRGIKKKGYKFEEISFGRWGKTMFCPICNRNTTHYKLINKEPIAPPRERVSFTPKMREKILTLLGGKDAFTNSQISSTPEIDHKIPWTRTDGDTDISKCSDDELKEKFQLLTREHNLLKDRACSKCKKENIRPPFFDINFWYEGDENYRGTCEGCGWYDGNKWRDSLNERITNL